MWEILYSKNFSRKSVFVTPQCATRSSKIGQQHQMYFKTEVLEERCQMYHLTDTVNTLKNEK